MTIACANYDREGTRKEKDNKGWVVMRINRCLGILQEALTLEDTEYKNTSWVGGYSWLAGRVFSRGSS